MPEIDISKLALLDERDGPAPAPREAAASVVTSDVFAPPDAFAPVVGPAGARPAPDPAPDNDAALGVERSTRAIRIESQWQRDKRAKQAAASAPPPRPPRRIAGVLAAILAIVAVAAAVVVLLRYQRVPAPRHPGGGVSIRITARPPVEVTVDGQRAGKTPLTLQRSRSSRPILITGPHGTRQVIPDRDQVVDLSR